MAAAAVVGGGVMAMSSLYQGASQAAAGQYNANMATQNAALAKQKAAYDEMKQRIVAKKQLGSMQAGYASSGITMSGSALDVMQASASSAEMDALQIRYGGDMQSAGFNMEADRDRATGSSAQSGAYMSAAGSMLTGGSKAYEMAG